MTRWTPLHAVFTCIAVLGAYACASEAKAPGQLVITVATDMALPQQIDTVNIQVLIRGQVILDQSYVVGPKKEAIPATLTLVAGKNPSEPVTIRVAGIKGDEWRTFREAITTIPTDRIALLRMPVQWLCDDTVQRISTSDGTGAKVVRMLSKCGDGNSCSAGKCVPSQVESKDLPDYSPKAVFGEADDAERGTCFDTVACMIKGRVVEPDAQCTIAKPNSDTVNVALRVPNSGICDSTSTACFVPLDGHSAEGWTLTPSHDRIALPLAVCDKLKARLVSGVYLSTECTTKSESIPPCGEWSSVPRDHALVPKPGATPDAPRASQVASLLSDATSTVCGPLMADGAKLYACLCSTGATTASVTSIDPTVQGTTGVVAQLDGQPNLAATVFGGSLYWTAEEAIKVTHLTGPGATTEVFPIDGAVFQTASLLADGSSVRFLASAVSMAKGSPVQLLALDPTTGTVTPSDTEGNKVVYQFDQDDSAVYVVRDVDQEAAADAAIVRRSTLVRIEKATGDRAALVPERTVTTDDVLHGGYLGVQADGAYVFALFEDAPQADGTVHVEVHRASAAANAGTSPPQIIYEATLDLERSYISVLGVVDGAVVVSRIDNGSSAQLRSSSLIVIPPGGGLPRIVADFAREYPVPGLVADVSSIYWLNSSGRVFKISRSALR